jgi:hypothetical protein
MNKFLLAGILFGILFAPIQFAFATPKQKVTICHKTSSVTNPYEQIVVSENAIGGHFDNPGTPKAGHEDDLLFQGEVDCPVPTATLIPTTEPTATEQPTLIPTERVTVIPTPTSEPTTLTPTPTEKPVESTPAPTQTPITSSFVASESIQLPPGGINK